jgi:hypothetical protein
MPARDISTQREQWSVSLPDSPDRPIQGQQTLVVRAAFVPDGEQPPPELMADFTPLHFPATMDTATGQITCANAGASLDGDISATWYPDEQQSSEDEDGPPGHQDGARDEHISADSTFHSDT